MTPQLCYTLRLYLFYNTTDGHSVFTSFDFDTGPNGVRAGNLRDEYATGTTHECFYDKNDLASVLWSISQTAGYWAASGIFAAFTFFGCFGCWHMLVTDAQDVNGDRCTNALCAINTWFWFAFVIGMILFLPLGLSPHIGKPALWYFGVAWTCFWTFVLLVFLLCTYVDGVRDCFIAIGELLIAACQAVGGCFVTVYRAISGCFAAFRIWFDVQWNAFHAWSAKFDDFVFCRTCYKSQDAALGPPKESPPPRYDSFRTPPDMSREPVDALSDLHSQSGGLQIVVSNVPSAPSIVVDSVAPPAYVEETR